MRAPACGDRVRGHPQVSWSPSGSLIRRANGGGSDLTLRSGPSRGRRRPRHRPKETDLWAEGLGGRCPRV